MPSLTLPKPHGPDLLLCIVADSMLYAPVILWSHIRPYPSPAV